ncbi:MAG: hypothetical protein BWY54_00020 [Candidatus Dependentiae bacterium ADurb.Bin331]|nr:MAG: hypothetical protein BWY54_00020 [Candidatus Dependentiae bacterium ADurb.Bin331]
MNRSAKYNVTGFTLIEVALALMIVGMLLTSLFALQNNITQGVTGYSQRLDRIFLMKRRLMQAVFDRAESGAPKPNEKKQQEIKDPETSLTSEIKSPSKGSSLTLFPSVVIEKVTARWKEWFGNRSETMITFLYLPEKKKS